MKWVSFYQAETRDTGGDRLTGQGGGGGVWPCGWCCGRETPCCPETRGPCQARHPDILTNLSPVPTTHLYHCTTAPLYQLHSLPTGICGGNYSGLAPPLTSHHLRPEIYQGVKQLSRQCSTVTRQSASIIVGNSWSQIKISTGSNDRLCIQSHREPQRATQPLNKCKYFCSPSSQHWFMSGFSAA